jgi:hypothetical protein
MNHILSPTSVPVCARIACSGPFTGIDVKYSAVAGAGLAVLCEGSWGWSDLTLLTATREATETSRDGAADAPRAVLARRRLVPCDPEASRGETGCGEARHQLRMRPTHIDECPIRIARVEAGGRRFDRCIQSWMYSLFLVAESRARRGSQVMQSRSAGRLAMHPRSLRTWRTDVSMRQRTESYTAVGRRRSEK